MLTAITAICAVKYDFSKYFKDYKVKGSFVLYDLQKNRYIRYNAPRCKKGFIPASTFKIFMALVGLETGVLRDENQIIKWDREDRYVSDWNQDLTLKDAVKYSAVWYMKEVARVVGGEKVKYYIDKVNYGNRDTCGGMEDFWLSGKMRISQEQQINFLRSLYLEKLPFSKRSIQIVKKIILVDDSSDYKIHAKTGWGETGKLNIGWYVGWIEKSGQVYFFATNIETVKPDNDSFPKSRIAITKSILRDLKIIE